MPIDDTDDARIDWHLLLLGLAGRMSDDAIARCRGLLADRRLTDVRDELIGAVLGEGAPLFPGEVDLLEEALGVTGETVERLSGIEITENEVPVGYRFAESTSGTDRKDRAVIRSTVALVGARGLWRSRRLAAAGGASPDAGRVYLVEADEDADLVAITGEIQRALGTIGRDQPRVEVYPTGLDLPDYHRLARAHGKLLWSREPDPGVRVAVLFDAVDPPLGPRFRPDHPRAEQEAQAELMDYLRRGKALLLTTGRLVDVVDHTRGRVVPTSYRTDGRWVWSDATTYYLESHGLLPDPDLVTHIRAQRHTAPVVDDVGMHRAMLALRQLAG
ncbi:hypothetical protein [Micromonospora sp. NPDC023814]|uniref:hypothetical protein n=1 Tax=Micromonospora sp. NPDC023814 TaxID=3154596 RepID=UPI0033CEF8C9